ncbi:MAG: hypothetical protein B0A82_11115 [Alkalinema sp. CACIAM 70d]|nr:MAG: hypothetical protein B0A82_11115 [Alkalinema sp. CACIAM 70d]
MPSRSPNKKPTIPHEELLKNIIIFGVIVTVILVQIEFTPSTSPPPITMLTKPGCVVKGNISVSTGRYLYHVPGMQNYNNTVINFQNGERWFCSEAEAKRAGWTKAPK